MALSDSQKSSLFKLLLSAGGGAGAGALLERLIRGKFGWAGPTGGALMGGGGYIVSSPGARKDLGAMLGWGAKKKEKQQQTTEDGSGMTEQDAIDVRAYIDEHWEKTRRVPDARAIKKRFPHLPNKEIQEVAKDAVDLQNDIRNYDYSAPGPVTTFMNYLSYPILPTGIAAELGLHNPALLSKIPGGALAGKAFVPLEAGRQGYDLAKGLFYNERKGKWQWNPKDYGENLKASQLEMENMVLNNNLGFWGKTGKGFQAGMNNPIRGIISAGGVLNDTANEVRNAQRTETNRRIQLMLDNQRKKDEAAGRKWQEQMKAEEDAKWAKKEKERQDRINKAVKKWRPYHRRQGNTGDPTPEQIQKYIKKEYKYDYTF
jgi:hypothetical protein